MHGDKSQSERSRILESFLNGECPVLVCTALLGRGIDLPHVSQVSIKISSLEKDHWGIVNKSCVALQRRHYIEQFLLLNVIVVVCHSGWK